MGGLVVERVGDDVLRKGQNWRSKDAGFTDGWDCEGLLRSGLLAF